LNLRKLSIYSIISLSVILITWWSLLLDPAHYNLFHLPTELFSIFIAWTIFGIAWNSRQFSNNSYFLFIGVSFLFVGSIDFLHALAYQGLNLLPLGETPNLATQLWILARYTQAFSFVISPFVIDHKLPLKTIFGCYLLTTITFIGLIFSQLFPDCYVTSLTPFKIFSEYVIIALFCSSLLIFYKKRDLFDRKMLHLLIISILFVIFSEFSFTLYLDVTGFFNRIGHIFKIIAFYWVYKALIEFSLRKPYELLFRNLQLERNSLKITNEQIKTIIKTVPDGILFLTAEGHIFLVNDSLREMYFNLYKETIPEGQKIESCRPNLFCNQIKEIYHTQTEKTLISKVEQGKYFQIIASQIQLTKDMPTGLLFVIRDVTEFLELENLQKQVISTVSHELRTPLTVIDLSIKNLKKYRDRISNSEREAILEKISKASNTLIKIVDDLLIVSRIDAKMFKIEWTKYNLNELLQELVTQFEIQLMEKKIDVEVKGPSNVILYGDPQRITQIINTLLDNAIKYSEEGSTIKLTTYNHYQGPYNINNLDGVLLSITDTGFGISNKDLPHIFKRFYRASSVSTIQGSGIGLSIAKELAQLHKGEIFVESQLKQGTTFHLFLPRLTSPN